jgi:hypothetical protein
MAVGPSNRIVLEVDPELKQALYSALHQKGLSLKDWFVQNAEQFLADKQRQLDFFSENQSVEVREGVAR